MPSRTVENSKYSIGATTKMVRKYGHGWFKESTRHSLAARGIKTNRYNANKYFVSRKDKLREYLRQGRFEEAEKVRRAIEKGPGVPIIPDPRSSRSEFARSIGSKDPETAMETLRYLQLSPEEKLELIEKEKKLKDIQKKMQDEEFREKRDGLKKTIKELREEMKDETDEERLEEMEEELEDLQQQLEPMIGLGNKRDELLDEVNELRGLGRRAEAKPGVLTEEQMLKRLGKKRVAEMPDVDDLSKEQLLKVFRSVFKEKDSEFPAAEIKVTKDKKMIVGYLPRDANIRVERELSADEMKDFLKGSVMNTREVTKKVVPASREEVTEKLPEGMKLTTDKEVSESEMRDFLRGALLRKKVATEKPLKRGFPNPKDIVVEGREDRIVDGKVKPGLLTQFGKIQSRTIKLDPGQTEMATATKPGTKMGRQPVSEIFEKRAEKAAERAAQKETQIASKRAQTSAPGKVLVEEVKAKRKDRKEQMKEWKDILGDDFNEKDFE